MILYKKAIIFTTKNIFNSKLNNIKLYLHCFAERTGWIVLRDRNTTHRGLQPRVIRRCVSRPRCSCRLRTNYLNSSCTSSSVRICIFYKLKGKMHLKQYSLGWVVKNLLDFCIRYKLFLKTSSFYTVNVWTKVKVNKN